MYFTLSQIQYLGLALFGGLILIAILAIAFWSYRLQIGAGGVEEIDDMGEEDVADEAAEPEYEHKEGHRPMPLIVVLLIIGIVVWGIGYTLAHSFGVFYAQ